MFMLSKILGIIPLQQISLSIPPPDKSSTGPVPVTILGFFIARLNPPTAYFRSILCRKAQSNKGLFRSHGGEETEPRCALPEREFAGAPACAPRAGRKHRQSPGVSMSRERRDQILNSDADKNRPRGRFSIDVL